MFWRCSFPQSNIYCLIYQLVDLLGWFYCIIFSHSSFILVLPLVFFFGFFFNTVFQRPNDGDCESHTMLVNGQSGFVLHGNQIKMVLFIYWVWANKLKPYTLFDMCWWSDCFVMKMWNTLTVYCESFNGILFSPEYWLPFSNQMLKQQMILFRLCNTNKMKLKNFHNQQFGFSDKSEAMDQMKMESKRKSNQ